MKSKTINLLTIFLMFIMIFFVGCNELADPTSTIESNKLKNEITKIFEKTHYVNKASQDTQPLSLLSLHGGRIYALEGTQNLLQKINNCNTGIRGLYDDAYAELNNEDSTEIIDLTVANKNGITSEMLRHNIMFLTTVQGLCDVVGDDILTNTYSMKSGNMDMRYSVKFDIDYSLNMYAEINSSVAGNILTRFKEYETDKVYCSYVFFDTSLEAGKNYVCVGYLDTNYGLMMAEIELTGDFADFETDTNAKVTSFKACLFDEDKYIVAENTDNLADIIAFVKTNLGVDKSVYNASVENVQTKRLSNAQMNKLEEKTSNYQYESPYYQTSQVNPRKSYTIPEGVTAVTNYTIPATKKLIIPKEVVSISSRALMYPDLLEEIVFEDAQNGALTTLGDENDYFFLSFTKVKNFVCPPTVTKLRLGYFHLATNMELLDLTQVKGFVLTNNGKDTESPELNINRFENIQEMGYIKNLKLPKEHDIDISFSYGGLDVSFILGEGTNTEHSIYIPKLSNVTCDRYSNEYKTYVQELGFTYTTNVVENMYVFYREFFSPRKGFSASNLFVNSDTLHTNFAKVANVYVSETYYTQTETEIKSKEEAYELTNAITVHMLVENWSNKIVKYNNVYKIHKLEGCTLSDTEIAQFSITKYVGELTWVKMQFNFNANTLLVIKGETSQENYTLVKNGEKYFIYQNDNPINDYVVIKTNKISYFKVISNMKIAIELDFEIVAI